MGSFVFGNPSFPAFYGKAANTYRFSGDTVQLCPRGSRIRHE
jgi:hypothetical protein